MANPTVESGKVVSIHYVLKNDAGEILDQSSEGHPLLYLHGAQNIVTGLEEALEGKGSGERVQVAVPPEKGYGPKQGPGPQPVRRSEFPKGMEIHEGMPVRAQDAEGNDLVLWVVKAEGAWVHLDINHPLAGETLHFDVTIADVRDATEHEVAHGHAHGPGGHH